MVRQLALLAVLAVPCWASAAKPVAAPPVQLRDINKKLYTSDFRNKVTLVHFWATWCTPCRAELPALLKTIRPYPGDRLQLILVAADSRDAVRTYVKDQNWNTPVLIDQFGSSLRDYGVTALPFTAIVDTRGLIVDTRQGAVDWNDVAIQTQLKRWLTTTPPGDREPRR